MTKYYVKWQMDMTKIPANREEMFKGVIPMGEMVNADLKAGRMKDWGWVAGGDSGYAIYEAANETELAALMLKYVPFIHFEPQPVLTNDQTNELFKKAAAAMKK
jgi:hypothetical protein